MRAARAGEAWAAEALYRRHGRMVRRIAARLARPGEREDLVQDVFLKAFGNLDKIERPERFEGWLASVVRRTAAIHFRRERRARLNLGELALEAVASRAAPPDVLAELAQVAGWLARIPAEARQVFLLRRVDRLSISEVAATLGRSTATVKRRLARAKQSVDRRAGGTPGR